MEDEDEYQKEDDETNETDDEDDDDHEYVDGNDDDHEDAEGDDDGHGTDHCPAAEDRSDSPTRSINVDGPVRPLDLSTNDGSGPARPLIVQLGPSMLTDPSDHYQPSSVQQ